MAASTFDTRAAADELRDAGFDEKQARAIIGIATWPATRCRRSLGSDRGAIAGLPSARAPAKMPTVLPGACAIDKRNPEHFP